MAAPRDRENRGRTTAAVDASTTSARSGALVAASIPATRGRVRTLASIWRPLARAGCLALPPQGIEDAQLRAFARAFNLPIFKWWLELAESCQGLFAGLAPSVKAAIYEGE